ncbi:SapC family protein [Quatrionicoccus australiensis]|uniref:SapC family protein n=1 Tax=Quatrionicoccus australiensis TaxID=138118 RepID=UPI001CF831BA|nr:SapC family protein [Quatrionicoccus australiensis]UCV14050.1 SapC family protein [Quatrionicoccus australiensis]
MTTLMFYQAPAPLNAAVSLRMRVRPLNGDYRFAAVTNSVPLAAVEFFDVAREWPIVFTDDEKPYPAMLTGVRNQENLLVGDDGSWQGRYVPAFIRRYPFVLGERPDSKDFDVYIDEGYEGINSEDGERLFNDDGSHTPLLKLALEFLSQFQGEVERTTRFVERLNELDLLVPRRLEVSRPGQTPRVLQGFRVVDEARLQALDDAALLTLARSGQLAWIYAHLMSLSNVGALAERLDKITALAEAPPVEVVEPNVTGESAETEATESAGKSGKKGISHV